MNAAAGGVAGVVRARVIVVAVERRARLAGRNAAASDHAQLGAIADIGVVATELPARQVEMLAPQGRIAAVLRARVAITTGERRPHLTDASGVADLASVADVSIVAR